MKAVQIVVIRNLSKVTASLLMHATRLFMHATGLFMQATRLFIQATGLFSATAGLFSATAKLFGGATRLFMRAVSLFRIVTGAALLGVSGSAFALLCSTDSDQVIPDGFGTAGAGAPATITIDFPASTDTITDLNFQLQLNINWVGDVGVTLTSPAGTMVTLIDRPGRPALGVFGCFRDNFNVLLDDSAALPAESQCPASNPTIAGTLRPTGNLSDFNGEEIGGTWTVTATDFAGGFVGTLIAAGTCIDETTTPVTLSSFKTKLKGEKLVAQWQTSSEVFNLGFNLWGEMNGDWFQLNKRLIPSASFDSVVPQKYRRRVNTGSYDSEITSVGISAFSTSGQEEFYGPFEIGEEYGEDAVPKYIDWVDQRAKFNTAMLDAGYVLVKGRWRKATAKYLKRLEKQQARYPDTLIRVEQDGIYQVSYEELLAQGIDYAGLPISKLALSLDGDPVSREISTEGSEARRFGPF